MCRHVALNWACWGMGPSLCNSVQALWIKLLRWLCLGHWSGFDVEFSLLLQAGSLSPQVHVLVVLILAFNSLRCEFTKLNQEAESRLEVGLEDETSRPSPIDSLPVTRTYLLKLPQPAKTGPLARNQGFKPRAYGGHFSFKTQHMAFPRPSSNIVKIKWFLKFLLLKSM